MTVALTRALLEAKAAEYEAEEPLYVVEAEQIEGLPGAFAAGAFGWRDAEWVVRWHFRRYLGAFPDAERRAREEAFGRNDLESVRAAIDGAASAEAAAEGVRRLTVLEGVDVPVASAFLQFVDPERYVVVGRPEWDVLHEAGELDDAYPDPPSPEAYGTYLAACRSLADRFDCTLLAIHRALWRLSNVR